MLNGVLLLLEPQVWKLTRSVLRGFGDGNIPWLPDTAGAGLFRKLFVKAPAAS